MFVFIICLCVFSVNGALEGRKGDICLLPDGNEGVCTPIQGCSEAVGNAMFRRSTKICGFNGTDPIVCCQRNDIVLSGCEPKTPRQPNRTFGRIAFEKCIEYQEQVVFPCTGEENYGRLSDGANETRRYRRGGCYDPPPHVVGSDGIDASRGQFAHMALLGYGTEVSSQWICGGTTISERFILTAGHCTHHRELGQVAFARLGILKRSDPMLDTRVYRIKRYIWHPQYTPTAKYNDIALLETEQRIIFVNKFVSPACLDVEDEPSPGEYLYATGWGALGEKGGLADVLQIMTLTKFTYEECSEHFGTNRHLLGGIDNETHLCYGHRTRNTDTCKGDSGGPLQTDLSSVSCMHKVIGVTSFGGHCGRVANPGVYTRVRPYVPWIEEQVWPQKEA